MFGSLLCGGGSSMDICLSICSLRVLRTLAPEQAWPTAAQVKAFNSAIATLSPSARRRVINVLAPSFGDGGPDKKSSRRRFVLALALAIPALTPWMRSVGRADASRFPSTSRAPGDKTRSVLFVHSAYYNFGYMAKALRARGWDAVSASTADPEGYPKLYTHGHDVVLYDADAGAMREKIARFVTDSLDRFGIVHFYGIGAASLFYENWDTRIDHDRVPWDFLEWKRRGALIGYSTSGCLDMVSQSTFRRWSGNMCDICPWQAKPLVCSDEKNLSWGWKVAALADLISLETDVRLDARRARNVFHEPLTYALDPEFWRPGLEIPPEFVQARERPDEVLVYHGVGNYRERLREGRNVKGTPAVLRTIETLQAEGVPIRLMFMREVPNAQNRYFQAQADIIVDQLNYGRYGAIAREGLMLGRPVVGAVRKDEAFGPPSRCIAESPIVHATEETVVDVLRDLATDPARRAALGAASRAYAEKWWSADILAARFEKVYDHLRATGATPSFEDIV